MSWDVKNIETVRMLLSRLSSFKHAASNDYKTL